MPLLRQALRVIRCANVRFGILPAQSGIPCRDDEQELDSRLRGNDEQSAR